MEYTELFGYKIFRNGKIIGLKGKELNDNRPQIRILWGKERKAVEVRYARFVYYAFNRNSFDFNDKSLVIVFKDGNKKNYSIDNLRLVSRKNIYQGENNKLSKLTNKQVESIKKEYNSYRQVGLGTNYPFKKISYRKLADKYNVSHTLIKNVIKGKTRNKENYVIK